MDLTNPAKGGSRGDLTQGKIGSTLLKFALPTLASSMLQTLNGTVSTIWVGRFIGESALAATSNANMVMFLMTAFVFGFGMASTILIGRAWGRRDVDTARRIFGSATGFFFLVTIVIATSGWMLSPAILALLGTPGGAAPLALSYLHVIFLAMPAIMLLTMLMMALRGAGDSMTPMWFMIVAVVLDGGLNPFFILGFGPVPRLGIAGSAVATLVANYGALLGLVAFVYWRDLPLRLRASEVSYLWPDAAILKTIILTGLPMGIQMIVISFSSLAIVGLVNHEGVDTTAAFGVAMQLWNYVQMPAMALGAAVSAMVAQNIGAGRWDRVGRITRIAILQAMLMTAGLLVALTLADESVLELFLRRGSAALPIARHIHIVASWNFLMLGVSMVLFGTVRANGAVWVPMILLSIGLVPVRFGYILMAYRWHYADAIWTSFPVASVIILVITGIYYLRGSWKMSAAELDPAYVQVEPATQAPSIRAYSAALTTTGSGNS